MMLCAHTLPFSLLQDVANLFPQLGIVVDVCLKLLENRWIDHPTDSCHSYTLAEPPELALVPPSFFL